jgi:Isochorismatase family.
VLAGTSTTLRVESHLRDAVENGFEVLAVADATAAAGENALETVLTNYNFIAHETATADEVVDRLATADARATDVSADSGTHR